MRIIFMGTPDFAVPSLEILLKNGYEVAGVITAPDRPAGRGQQLKESPVKKLAKQYNLNILQPTNLKNEEFTNELKALQTDLQVVVAFRMLPESIWGMPPKGTLNLHASLLPDYRGAAPINWAIINGEKQTGVTTFIIEKEIDTGKIIFQEQVKIEDDMNAGQLHDKLMLTGAELVLKTVKAVQEDKVIAIPQTLLSDNKIAPKIFKNDCQINWQQPTGTIYDFIRGLSPYPAAWTKLNDKTFKIYNAEKQSVSHTQAPGTSIIQSSILKFATNDGFIVPKIVQMEGKNKMAVDEFLRGFQN